MLLFGGTPHGNTFLGDTWEYGGTKFPLTTDTSAVSLAKTGVQTFSLDAGTQHANKLYLLVGTLSGTKPGIQLGAINLPLNFDAYFNVALAFPNSPLLTTSLGKLDAAGRASAKFTAISLIPTSLVNQVFHHAYVVIGSAPFDFASNAVPLTLRQ